MKTVKYTPQPGKLVPGWRTGQEREVANDVAADLLATGQFTEVKPPKKPKTTSTEQESDS